MKKNERTNEGNFGTRSRIHAHSRIKYSNLRTNRITCARAHAYIWHTSAGNKYTHKHANKQETNKFTR